MAPLMRDPLIFSDSTAREMLQFCEHHAPSSDPYWMSFPAEYAGIPIEIMLGSPIRQGVFKCRLTGHWSGRTSPSEPGFIGYFIASNPPYQSISTLITSVLESRTVDTVFTESMCASRRHGMNAERAFSERWSNGDRTYEEICLLVTGRCRFCYEEEKRAAPDFASLVPDAEPTRSWR